MNDPYKVLGVSQNATDEEVRAAYRALVKKYHPDNYVNNPLADLATEKMKEINEAYDQITKTRSSGSSGGAGGFHGSYGGYSGPSGSGSGNYVHVREMINSNRVQEAKSALDSIPVRDRDAEWFFLSGCVFYKMGWINEAYMNFKNAAGMDPSNSEYREAVNRISAQMNGGYGRNPYGGGYGNYDNGGCNGCDLCAGLACADCCCNGMGGC